MSLWVMRTLFSLFFFSLFTFRFKFWIRVVVFLVLCVLFCVLFCLSFDSKLKVFKVLKSILPNHLKARSQTRRIKQMKLKGYKIIQRLQTASTVISWRDCASSCFAYRIPTPVILVLIMRPVWMDLQTRNTSACVRRVSLGNTARKVKLTAPKSNHYCTLVTKITKVTMLVM